MTAEPAVPARPSAPTGIIKNDAVENEAAKITAASTPAQNTSSAFTSPGSATAPAPAKKVAAPPAKQNKTVEPDSAKPSYYKPSQAAPMPSSVSVADAPSFAALGAEDDSCGSGGNKKILIAAGIVLALAALGYFGYGKPGKSSTAAPASQPASAPQDSGKQDSGQPAPALAPMSSPVVPPSPDTPNRASLPIQTSAPKTATTTSRDLPPLAAPNPAVTRIAINPGPATMRPDLAPLLVKSNPAGSKMKSQSQDSAPPLPSPPSIASASDNALSGLLPSSSSLPKPALATARISQGVSQGLLIKRVQPKYPQAALAVHAQGAVQIEAIITKEGNVTNLRVLSGDPVLARAALDAVRQWRYKPYQLDGEPVEIETQITVNFKAN
jgi:protein TonB